MTLKDSQEKPTALQAAQQALKAGEVARAAKLARQAIQEDPGDPRPWLVLAFLADSAAARGAYLERAEAIKPGDATVQQARQWAERKFGAAIEKEAAATATAAQAAAAGPGGVDEMEVVAETVAGEAPVSTTAGVPVEARAARTRAFRLTRYQPDLVWTAVGAAILTALILTNTWLPWLSPMRWLLGLIYILFVPGYWLVGALFPGRSDIDGIERVGLSLGLSVAWVSILALILDWLPWGLRLWPIFLGELVSIAVFMGVTLFRRGRLPQSEAFLPPPFQPRTWWRSQSAGDQRIYKVMAGVLTLAILAVAWVLLVPSPSEFMTEFYILGSEGLAENYPRQGAVGEALSVTVGVTNLEGEAHNYRVEAWAVDPWEAERRQVVGEMAAFSLAADENFEYPLGWSMPWAGEDQQVEIYLYIDEGVDPYRQLRLWLDVLPAEE